MLAVSAAVTGETAEPGTQSYFRRPDRGRDGRERELGRLCRDRGRDDVHERDCDVEAAERRPQSERRGIGLGVLGRSRGVRLEPEALEQIGSSADCDSQTGKPSYYAWYELVPNPSVTVKTLTVSPGDLITASVNVVAENTVLVQLKNRTRSTSFTKKLTFENPDLTRQSGWPRPLLHVLVQVYDAPLSDFGSVDFTRIAAIGNGVGGTLTSNPGWTATPITLAADGGRGFFPGPRRFAGASPRRPARARRSPPPVGGASPSSGRRTSPPLNEDDRDARTNRDHGHGTQGPPYRPSHQRGGCGRLFGAKAWDEISRKLYLSGL